jgi:putative MATE family efflux protein
MDVEMGVASLGTSYLRVLFLGSASLFLFQVVESVFRAVGDTKTPLLLLLGSIAANLALDPVLILGLGPFPELGVTGAAWASVLARGTFALLALALMLRKGVLESPSWGAWRPEPKTWLSVLRIGVPASANGVFFCAVYMILARITADFGTPALAALGVGHKGEAPCYFVALGISLAVAPLVGQSLGAGRPERARAAAWLAVRTACAWGVVWTVVLFTLPQVVAGAFVEEWAVVHVASRYLVIMGFSQVLMCVEVVLDGAFAGAGDTLPPLLIGLPLTAARIPLAWLFAHPLGLGVDGIWVAITVSTIAKGILMTIWFRRGRWQERRVG